LCVFPLPPYKNSPYIQPTKNSKHRPYTPRPHLPHPLPIFGCNKTPPFLLGSQEKQIPYPHISPPVIHLYFMNPFFSCWGGWGGWGNRGLVFFSEVSFFFSPLGWSGQRCLFPFLCPFFLHPPLFFPFGVTFFVVFDYFGWALSDFPCVPLPYLFPRCFLFFVFWVGVFFFWVFCAPPPPRNFKGGRHAGSHHISSRQPQLFPLFLVGLLF